MRVLRVRSIRLDSELDEPVRRAAAHEGETVSEFLRRAAAGRAQRTLLRCDQLENVIGAVPTQGGAARQTGAAFTDVLGGRTHGR